MRRMVGTVTGPAVQHKSGPILFFDLVAALGGAQLRSHKG